MLHLRAKTASKDQMIPGEKSGQAFSGLVCMEHNTGGEDDEDAYGDLVHNHIDVKTMPDEFSPTLTWKQARVKFQQLLKAYKEVFCQWKQSGTHEQEINGIVKTVCDTPFKKFTNAVALIYMHPFIKENQNILDTSLGNLPKDVFQELITMVKLKGRSNFKLQKKSNTNNNQAEFNAIYKAPIDCRKEEVVMKKQATAIKSMTVLNQEKQCKQGVIQKYEDELLEAR